MTGEEKKWNVSSFVVNRIKKKLQFSKEREKVDGGSDSLVGTEEIFELSLSLNQLGL